MPGAFERSVVVILAHPDDAEISAAGTLKLLKDIGYRITVCPMTTGGLGGVDTGEKATMRKRIREAEAAAEILGAEFCCLGARDGFVYDTARLRIEALKLIRRANAGVVITHLPQDYHADHRATCSIVEAAAMIAALPHAPCGEPPLAVTPLLYHSSTLGLADPLGNPIFQPHFYVNIDSTQEIKSRMLSCHQSQIEFMRVMMKMDDFFSEMRKQDLTWGAEAGCQYAEAFWQHRGGGFQKHPQIQTALGSYVIPGSSVSPSTEEG
jgi:LmbE family N-acetylglucosaminyl deacetylase